MERCWPRWDHEAQVTPGYPTSLLKIIVLSSHPKNTTCCEIAGYSWYSVRPSDPYCWNGLNRLAVTRRHDERLGISGMLIFSDSEVDPPWVRKCQEEESIILEELTLNYMSFYNNIDHPFRIHWRSRIQNSPLLRIFSLRRRSLLGYPRPSQVGAPGGNVETGELTIDVTGI